MRTAAYKRKRGEQKHRPGDQDRALLADLWGEINLLRQLWKQNEIKVITDRTIGPKEVALDIVLRRNGNYQEQSRVRKLLVNFDKNRAHRRRSKV